MPNGKEIRLNTKKNPNKPKIQQRGIKNDKVQFQNDK
jgi:hypothetical protein